MTLRSGSRPVSSWIASRSSGIALRSSRGLGPERLHYRFVRLDVRPADEVDAVGHRREDPLRDGFAGRVLRALEGLADRFRLAGQVDDQRALADHRDLAGKDGG